MRLLLIAAVVAGMLVAEPSAAAAQSRGQTFVGAAHVTTATAPSPRPGVGAASTAPQQFAPLVVVSRDKRPECIRNTALCCQSNTCLWTVLLGATMTPTLYYRREPWMLSSPEVTICPRGYQDCGESFFEDYSRDTSPLVELSRNDSFKDLAGLPSCRVLLWKNKMRSTPFAVKSAVEDDPCN